MQPELIINTGTTGSFNKNVSLGDIAISNRSVYSDVNATGFGSQWGQVPQMPKDYLSSSKFIDFCNKLVSTIQFPFSIHFGTIVTSDSFMSDENNVKTIQEKMGAILASDMESTAIVQVASFYDIPVINIRGILDYVGTSAPETFKETIHIASENASQFLLQLVEQLNYQNHKNR